MFEPPFPIIASRWMIYADHFDYVPITKGIITIKEPNVTTKIDKSGKATQTVTNTDNQKNVLNETHQKSKNLLMLIVYLNTFPF